MNYIIASYAGTKFEYSLEIQMQTLFTLLLQKQTTYLKQITIVCPPVKSKDVYKQNYYNWDKWIALFREYLPHIGIIYMDYVGENLHASYDQWIQAIQKFPEFDYYLLVEDDYCIHPTLSNFDSLIIKSYKTLTNGSEIGYACTYADKVMGHPYHAAISNGIVSKKTIQQFGELDILKEYYTCADEYKIEQVAFSNLFLKYDIPVYSLHNLFKAIFWSSYRKKVECYSPDTIESQFFIPIQYLINNN